MIFSFPKTLTSTMILQDLQIIIPLILQLGDFITQNQASKQYLESVNLSYQQISTNLTYDSKLFSQLSKNLQRQPWKINLKTVDQITSYIKRWFDNYKNEEQSISVLQKTLKALQLQGKLNSLEELINYAANFQDDITTFRLNSNPKYSQIYKNIQVIQCTNLQKTRAQYQYFQKLMVVTNASVLTQLRQPNSLLGVMAFGLGFPRFWIDYKEAQLRNYSFTRNPNLEQLIEIWNLPEKGAISKLKTVLYPFVHTSRLIYIPIDQNNFESVDLFTPSKQSVPVRVISNKPITFFDESNSCFGNCQNSSQIFTSVILHAHGGGFVALSSHTMQNYTRRWAKQIDVPIFSIDYGKPPEHIFPRPVFQTLAVYKFIWNKIHRHCNIQPNKVVMAGDSAGSNLLLSAYALAMRQKLPAPQGFFLAYPASDLRFTYTPSRIYSFSDAILHPALLILCLKEYLGNRQKQIENDPLASPILLTEGYVRQNFTDNRWPLKWPKSRIMVGELDPLLDDSLRLCSKMTNSKIDVRLKIYKGLSHGFLSVENMISQGQRGITHSIDILKELFGIQQLK